MKEQSYQGFRISFLSESLETSLFTDKEQALDTEAQY